MYTLTVRTYVTMPVRPHHDVTTDGQLDKAELQPDEVS